METNDNPIREDRPLDINPNETSQNHPAKDLKSQHKIDIKESELGREQSQQPITEHMDDTISQIDKGTVDLQKQNSADASKKPLSEGGNQSDDAEVMDGAGTNPINETDDRDHRDSTEDWNAENNDSGRRK